MSRVRIGAGILAASVGALLTGALIIGCSGPAGSDERVNAGGSSFVAPLMSKWTHEYDKATGVQVNYESIGSGGGIQQMAAQTLDFGCTDAPMTDAKLEEAKGKNGKVLHIPLAMGGVVPIYNLPGVDKPLRFSGPVLADIFMGKIKKWNAPEIAKLNPGVELPDLDILVTHRSDGSGTTYIFADYLAKVSPEWKDKIGVGKSLKWPSGVGGKGNEGVSGAVSRSEGAIGYVELIYALQHDAKYGSVQNKEGEFVVPSLESVTAAVDNALTDIPEDLRYSITNASGKESYPISGTVWAVVYVKQDPAKGKKIHDFLHWVTHDGQKFAKEKHYAPLPKGLIERIDKKLEELKAGSTAASKS